MRSQAGDVDISKGLRNCRISIIYARIQGDGLGHLKGLSQLKSLDLEGNPVDDAGIANLRGLSQLQVLNLTGTRVTDAGLQYLTQLEQLVTLYLRDTEVTEKGNVFVITCVLRQ